MSVGELGDAAWADPFERYARVSWLELGIIATSDDKEEAAGVDDPICVKGVE